MNRNLKKSVKALAEAGGEEFAAKTIAGIVGALMMLFESKDTQYMDIRSLKITVNDFYECYAFGGEEDGNERTKEKA